jgi:hypothetical protein
MNKFIIAALVLVFAVTVSGFYMLSGRIDELATSIGVTFGAASGQTHSNPEQFLSEVYVQSQSGVNLGALPGVTTSTIPTTAASTTAGLFTWKTVCDNGIVDVALPDNTFVNLTLPSSTYLGTNCLKKTGDYREFMVHNASSTGGFTLVVSDQSSTIKKTVPASSTYAIGNATTSLNFKDFAHIRVIRVVSSTVSATGTVLATSPWYYYLVNVFR